MTPSATRSNKFWATHEALALGKTRDLVLRRAWAELQAFKRKYKGLDAFSKLFEVIDEIEGTLGDDVLG